MCFAGPHETFMNKRVYDKMSIPLWCLYSSVLVWQTIDTLRYDKLRQYARDTILYYINTAGIHSYVHITWCVEYRKVILVNGKPNSIIYIYQKSPQNTFDVIMPSGIETTQLVTTVRLCMTV